ncbi:hypothetical protein DL769_000265 [Monosporascus sp. CRB-8-3]|nr:hypothetical protein DL769_000265 [Monosporascus sp. CRB-8-3]
MDEPGHGFAFFCVIAIGLATLGSSMNTNSITIVVTSPVGGWAPVPGISRLVPNMSTFLSSHVAALAPLLSIMIADYWVVSRRG